MDNKNTNKSLTSTGAVRVIERSKSFEDLEHPKKKFWHVMIYGILLVCFVILIKIMIGYEPRCDSRNVFCRIFQRSLITLRDIRSIIYTILLGLAFYSIVWKPARKVGLFVFYFVAGAVIAFTGQVVDYVTRSDARQYKTDIGSVTFGDYGIVSECGYGGCKKQIERDKEREERERIIEEQERIQKAKANGKKPCHSQEDCGGYNSGYFCNSFGMHTPNVCEKTNPESISRNGQVYYYNSLSDLRSWCREAYESQADRDSPGNCNWGYLSYQSARSWCASIGKNLVYPEEIKENCEDFSFLPKANPDQQYWTEGMTVIHMGQNCSIQEMIRGDGYTWAAGVICK